LGKRLLPEKEDRLLPTQCNQESFESHPLAKREVRGRFDGGANSGDARGLLLCEVEKRTGIIRDPARVEHTVEELVAQGVYPSADGLGYEDLNDHDQLRHDISCSPTWPERSSTSCWRKVWRL
jgi:hypothetical protein